MVSPSVLVRSPGLATPTRATFHRKCWLLLGPPSEAVTVTRYGLLASALAAMVPAMTPLLLPILSPEGRPVAEYVSVPLAASVATRASDTVSPAALAWSSGPANVMRGLTNQLKVWLALLVPALAVTVTEYG